jgi:2-methylcitrate dehydratase PrpD
MSAFAAKIEYDDLPANVVHQMKRVILDSIGCAFIGHTSDRGRIAAELAIELDGPAQSTIFGSGKKVACTNAAFANGESMNALDYDALSAAAVHDVPIIIAATLALAESTNASGKDLILAATLAFELSARLKAAGAKIRLSDSGEFKWPAVLGYGAVTLAAAAGAAKLLHLDNEKTANAVAIAGGICPPNIFKKFTDTTPIAMIKYCATGWEAQTALTAAMLAQSGYLGNTQLFTGDYGYYKYMGMGDIKERAIAELLADLGANWRSHQINYKQYPCCGHLASVIDAFKKIIDVNGIVPEDIKSIVVHLDSISQFRVFQENDLVTPDDYCFSAPYIFACAAHRITHSYWHDRETKQDPAIGRFMDRVNFELIPNEKVAGMSRRASMEEADMRIMVTAKDDTFKEKITYMKGSWEPEEFSNSDGELIAKFSDNVSRVLSAKQADKAAKAIFELDKADSMSRLAELLKS